MFEFGCSCFDRSQAKMKHVGRLLYVRRQYYYGPPMGHVVKLLLSKLTVNTTFMANE